MMEPFTRQAAYGLDASTLLTNERPYENVDHGCC